MQFPVHGTGCVCSHQDRLSPSWHCGRMIFPHLEEMERSSGPKSVPAQPHPTPSYTPLCQLCTVAPLTLVHALRVQPIMWHQHPSRVASRWPTWSPSRRLHTHQCRLWPASPGAANRVWLQFTPLVSCWGLLEDAQEWDSGGPGMHINMPEMEGEVIFGKGVSRRKSWVMLCPLATYMESWGENSPCRGSRDEEKREEAP